MRGPGGAQIWGERREYTWFIRDGFFIRSPLKFNGVEIGDGDRRKFEADYLKRQQEREQRRQRAAAAGQPPPSDTTIAITNNGIVVEREDDQAAQDEPLNVDGLLKQTRQPEFISSASHASVPVRGGQATRSSDARRSKAATCCASSTTRRICSAGPDRRRRSRKARSERDKAYDAAYRRMMNKVALVTLWVEPKAHQIVKYTVRQRRRSISSRRSGCVHVDDVRATMTMSAAVSGRLAAARSRGASSS